MSFTSNEAVSMAHTLSMPLAIGEAVELNASAAIPKKLLLYIFARLMYFNGCCCVQESSAGWRRAKLYERLESVSSPLKPMKGYFRHRTCCDLRLLLSKRVTWTNLSVSQASECCRASWVTKVDLEDMHSSGHMMATRAGERACCKHNSSTVYSAKYGFRRSA